MAKINAKKKGNRGELECSKIFNERFNTKEFKRTPGSGMYFGGKNREINETLSQSVKETLVSDIMTPLNFKFAIEHKSYNEMNFWDLFNPSSNLNSWVDQVSNDAEFVEKLPLLIMKFNQKKRIAMITIEPKSYQFIWLDQKGQKWYCEWLEKLLEEENNFWFG